MTNTINHHPNQLISTIIIDLATISLGALWNCIYNDTKYTVLCSFLSALMALINGLNCVGFEWSWMLLRRLTVIESRHHLPRHHDGTMSPLFCFCFLFYDTLLQHPCIKLHQMHLHFFFWLSFYFCITESYLFSNLLVIAWFEILVLLSWSLLPFLIFPLRLIH